VREQMEERLRAATRTAAERTSTAAPRSKVHTLKRSRRTAARRPGTGSSTSRTRK
jgi:hypothetical protein